MRPYLLSLILPCVLLSLLVPGFSAAGEAAGKKVLILPYVEEDEDFFTGLSLLNTGDEVLNVSVSSYGKSGRVLGNRTITIEPGARFLGSLSDIFGYEEASKTGWLRIVHDGTLEGFGLLGNDRQLTRLSLENRPKKRLILPYALSGNGISTELSILNPGPDMAFLTITLYDSDGAVLGTYPIEAPLLSGQKLTGSLSALFGNEAALRTSYLAVESNAFIIGLGLVGNSETLLAVPMR